MNYETLKQNIYQEGTAQTLAICRESNTDILVDDFENDKYINFHMVPPTETWLAARFIWGPSFGEETAPWTAYLSRFLTKIDPAMLVCLNRIIIIDGDDDIEAVMEQMGTENDFPDMNGDVLGCLWFFENSVVIDVAAIRAAAREMAVEDPMFFNMGEEMERGFMITLIHETRHLGLDCNIFLPEDEYPIALQSEEAVEEWARVTYESI